MTPSGRADKILAAMSPSDAKILDRRDLPEYVTAIVVIIISLGLYAFLKLTGEVVDGDTVGFDQQLLLMLRNPADLADPVGPEWLEVIVRDLTALGGAVPGHADHWCMWLFLAAAQAAYGTLCIVCNGGRVTLQ